MKSITGKCHCGKNKYQVTGEPTFQFTCYCSDCRVLNGGGHLCGMAFQQDQLTEAVETKSYSYQGGSKHPIVMHFCPECSTSLYGYPTAHEGMVVIRANTLIDGDFQPQQTLFAESAFHWDKPTEPS